MRLIVGISGATGAIYGIRLLEVLRLLGGIETHLVMTATAKQTIVYETDYTVAQVSALASAVYSDRDVGAAIASGSFRTAGMVIAPCSIKTLSGLAHSYDDNLLVRAGDVVLKERRRLVLLLRETPLHLGHLRLMTAVTEAGAVVMPPVPAFYTRPRTLDELINQTIGRVLDQFDLATDLFERWQGLRAGLRAEAGANDARADAEAAGRAESGAPAQAKADARVLPIPDTPGEG
jgi:4-hydroxy-3-polyprenylbenzoate decarboxylase